MKMMLHPLGGDWRIGAVLLALAALAVAAPACAGEIHDAAKAGNHNRVKALLQSHPDLVNAKDEEGRTPLHLAAEKGDDATVIALLDHNAA